MLFDQFVFIKNKSSVYLRTFAVVEYPIQYHILSETEAIKDYIIKKLNYLEYLTIFKEY